MKMKDRQRLVHMMPFIPALLMVGSLLCQNSHAIETDVSQDSGVTKQAHILYRAQRRQAVDDNARSHRYLAQNAEDVSQARERWQNLSPEQKRQYRKRLQRWKQLTPEQKATIKNRYEHFKNLPPEKQTRVRENWRRYKRLDEGQRRVIRQKYQRWKNLSEAQKQQIRERRRRYKKMTPEQRRRLQENRKRWQELSPEEKRQLREKNRKRRLQNQDGPQQYNRNLRQPQGARLRN
jgi:hypothetical protein